MPKQRHWTFWLYMVSVTWGGLFLIYGWKNTQFMLDLYDKAALTMYRGETPEGVAAMAYPPLLVATYIPFLSLTELAQRIAMLGVMSVLLVCVFSTIQTMIIGKHPFKQTALFWVLVTLIVGRYVVSPIENYSHDIFIAAMVVLGIRYWAQCKEGRGGALLGVAAACKATPLLFLPFLVLQKRWKAAMLMAITTAVAFVLPDLLFPRESGTWAGHWFSLVLSSLHLSDGTAVVHWSTWNQLNQSISGTIERLFSFPVNPHADAVDVSIATFSTTTISYISYGARVLILGILFFAFYKPSKAPLVFRRFCEGAILSCGMLLLSPMSSKAHFFLLLLPGVVMARFYLWERRDWILTLIFIIMFLYGTLTVKDLVGTYVGHAVLATGSVTWCTLLAMLGTWRVMLLSQESISESS